LVLRTTSRLLSILTRSTSSTRKQKRLSLTDFFPVHKNKFKAVGFPAAFLFKCGIWKVESGIMLKIFIVC
ncbi:MAG: hypothetical protein ACI4J6_07015, partial [Oscillospiraceae bacterium]